MEPLTAILVSSVIVALVSFVGFFTLSFSDKKLEQIMLLLVALSAGTMLGSTFLHIIPKTVLSYMIENTFLYIIAGFLVFYIIEKIFHWRHAHDGKTPVHKIGRMNLFGDLTHNFVEGLIIAAGFMTDFTLGIATALAVILHEIPQEIGDINILLRSGFQKKRAFVLNFSVSLTTLLGGVVGYVLSVEYTSTFMPFLLPFAAGGFVYIAASDLIPEIRQVMDVRKSVIILGVFLLGVGVMQALTTLVV